MDDDPIEDEYAFHVTNQIMECFRRLGFDVIPVPISRIKEKMEGYDWRYEIWDLNKAFMLQFKRPNMRDKNISWEIDHEQHHNIRNKPHIFYCLPNSKEREEMNVMFDQC